MQSFKNRKHPTRQVRLLVNGYLLGDMTAKVVREKWTEKFGTYGPSWRPGRLLSRILAASSGQKLPSMWLVPGLETSRIRQLTNVTGPISLP